MFFGILRTVFMEKKAKNNSSDFSIPSTQSEKDETALEKSKHSDEQKKKKRIYKAILRRDVKELPPVAARKEEQTGTKAKTQSANIHKRLTEHVDMVVYFAKDPYVSFINNFAEREMRMSKVKQNVSGTFKTERDAYAYCRISSCLHYAKYHTINTLVAIQIANAKEPFEPAVTPGYVFPFPRD